jgi:hypothetical protein
MGIFDEVGISWKGREYKVTSDRVMGLIEVVEEVVTLNELTQQTGVKLAKISRAYMCALHYAGAKNVTQEQIYSSMIGNNGEGVEMQTAINALLMMMIPPEHLRAPEKKASTPQKRKRNRKAVNAS